MKTNCYETQTTAVIFCAIQKRKYYCCCTKITRFLSV